MLRSCCVFRASAPIVLLVVASYASSVHGEGRSIAEVTRTSDARFVHRIKLLDEAGSDITADSIAPYSTRTTCGTTGCHNYDEISKGTHTRMFPNDGFDPKDPDAYVWSVFDAATGVQVPLSYGFFLRDGGKSATKGDVTTFTFATKFGGFHPGGGRLEFDSEGKRYDKRLAEDEQLRTLANRDYFMSRWDQSGVLEADCLACHSLTAYDHAERAAQIAVMNFKWAPTVGMGFGSVSGRVSTMPVTVAGAEPTEPPVKVKYDPTVFDTEGRVHLSIGRPPDWNCLYCHRRPAKHAVPWSDCLDADVHSQLGLRCVECHRCKQDHIIAGDRKAVQHAYDRDYSTLTCEGCHRSGRLGAPVPKHKRLRRLHLEKIACETCHCGPRPRRVALALEQPTDPLWGLVIGPHKPSGPTVWAPIFAKDEGGKVRALVRMLPRWYARRTETGLEPLEPRGLVPIFFRVAKEAMKDDDGDITLEVNRNAEITAMLAALKDKEGSPVYLAGGRAYELDDAGQLTSEPNALADPIDKRLAHNVRPAEEALGARGCDECHRTGSAFFLSIGLTRAMGDDSQPEGEPLYKRIGKSRFDVKLGAMRAKYLRPYAPWVALFCILVMALHYVLFGPQPSHREEPEEDSERFGWFERLTHITLLVSFVILAVTGFSLIYGVEEIGAVETRALHEVVAIVLVVSLACAGFMWVRDMVFAQSDWHWLKALGGYLGYRGHVPMARFNAGQKCFFWFICLMIACLVCSGWIMGRGAPQRLLSLAYAIHELCAFVMVLLIIGHVYMGVLVNPGTLRGVFEGRAGRTELKDRGPGRGSTDD